VDLPSYFGAENKDFKYQLTVIGQFAQAIIGKEISSNQFEIMTDKPNVKVSWQVTGVRQDAYANAHRIVPEVQKESKNIGRYLHPVELGKSKNLAIGSAVLTAAERNALQKKIQYVQQNSKKSVDFNALKTKVLAAKAAATTVNGGKK
jgi:hypothetical protein